MYGIDSVAGDRRPVEVSAGAVHVVSASEAAGEIAHYHVTDQSTTRTRISIPTGAKAYRLYYNARRSAGVEDATGELLKVVEGIASTTAAGLALAEAAFDGSSGGDATGVSYVPVPINTGLGRGMDKGDLLYYLDFLTAVAESGDSDVIIELSL